MSDWRALPEALLPVFAAECVLCLWLLIKGVDVPKWASPT